MYTRPHHSPLTRVFAWAAVTAATLLATTFALSSPALAREDGPAESTTEPSDTTTQTPTDDSTESEPTDAPDEADPSKKSQEDTEESDGVTAAVEPDFGYNKFRVGVRLEDPSEAGGLTTLGSTIRITERSEGGGTDVTECTTTLEDPVEPTTTYCEDLAPDELPEELDFYEDHYISSGVGSEIEVRQTGVNDGLEIIDGTKIVEPCGECEDDEGDVLLTDAVPDDDDDDDDDGDGDGGDEDEDEEGTLPNVGAPDAALLGYGAILLAVGSRLIAGGRSHPRHRADGAII